MAENLPRGLGGNLADHGTSQTADRTGAGAGGGPADSSEQAIVGGSSSCPDTLLVMTWLALWAYLCDARASLSAMEVLGFALVLGFILLPPIDLYLL